MKSYVCETELGWMGLGFSERGLRATTLPGPSAGAVEEEIRCRGGAGPAGADEVGDWPQRLRCYARREAVSIDGGLDLEQGTPFQRDVWRALLEIPRGETRSYRWVAERVGRPRAVRAVGQAVGANPLPIVVPCHRVVRSDGSLGGFGGGLAMKKRLLNLEGATDGKQ